MMLLQVKSYIAERGQVTLQELMWQFKCDADGMRCLLQHWQRKGKVVKAPSPVGCGTRCTKCRVDLAEEYCWVAQSGGCNQSQT